MKKQESVPYIQYKVISSGRAKRGEERNERANGQSTWRQTATQCRQMTHCIYPIQFRYMYAGKLVCSPLPVSFFFIKKGGGDCVMDIAPDANEPKLLMVLASERVAAAIRRKGTAGDGILFSQYLYTYVRIP